MLFFKKIFLFLLWCGVFFFQVTIYWGDRFAWKILRYDKKSRYVRMGSCQRTGMCCQSLGIELPASWIRQPWLVKLFQSWYATVHNFQSTGDPQGRLLPLSCGHLREGQLCSIYPYRPKLCREYPFVSLFGRIELHRGCGFWFLKRTKLGSFAEKLAEKEHDAESPPLVSPH